MRSRKTLIPTIILAVCLIHGGAAFGSGLVEFPNKAAKAGELRVSGPGGFQFNQSFKAGGNASLSLFDQDGNHLADGTYKWEMAYQGVATGDRDAFHARAEPASGTFMIKDGAVVGPAIEGGFNKDQQFLDDVIIDGSLCVGFDCVNGESFGFDTIRMKENNLRLRAQDTSTSASFPTNDWQLTFNDTSNGGANKFSVDDIDGGRTPFTIEAGAPSHSLYVEDGGRLGLGTSTPVADIHVKSGNTPTLRLEQDGTSGFGAQTWDVAGNEANFFIRDASNGSTLPFRIFPGAPSNAISIEATTGDVGFGTTSPDANVDIEADGPVMRLTNLGGGGKAWNVFVNSGQGRFNIQNATDTLTPLKIDDAAVTNMMSLGTATNSVDDANTISFGRDGGPSITVDIEGSVIVNGTPEHPDFVFEADYELPSIADQAAFMWQNKHLPALPKAPEGLKGPVDLVAHQMAILEELEKAHIYIEQLHQRLETKDAVLTDIQVRLDTLEGTED